MELNAEKIKKALDVCGEYTHGTTCNRCPYMHIELADNEICSNRLSQNALALITSLEQRISELEIELKAMRGTANAYKMHIVELTEENESLNQSYTNLEPKCASLTKENEKLRVVLKMNDAPFPEGLQIVHDFCEKGKRIAKSDTVKKMQELIAEHATNEYPRKVRLDVVDQIAKEMLEESNERKN